MSPAAAQPQPAARPAKAAARPEAAPPADVEARRREISAASEGLKGRNHFEVLGISKASNEAQVKEAYFRLARRFHPDSIRKEVALADLAERSEGVFIRIGEAYEVLRDARRRSSYEADLASRTPRPGPQAAASAPSAPGGAAASDPEADTRAVENAIRVGERHVAEEKYWDAIQVLEAALPLATGKASGRARYVLAKALLKNPHWIKRAEELLLGLIKDEPMHLGAHLQLGHIYKGGGLKARAGSMYRKVLELQPEHEEATLGLRDLAPPPDLETEAEPPAGGGRLLKRFFNKN
jgi:tetratricopeptide (TPR) repeat protein